MRQKSFKFLNGVTATTVGERFNIEGVSKMTLQFIRANHAAGSSAFVVEVSNDGVNWVAYNKLISNVTNTNAQNKTRAAGPTLASNTSSVHAMDFEDDCYKYMRVSVTETTDGTHTCIGEGMLIE